ncbi:hypothetical protein K9U39_03190 [Rhodoblastus acidophilus]|uniref:Uncharacterized protein n=1 Tax=Candidatus Rhodoblastus alkanivorans TaxID=2954117 RepID=A0ABS9Z5I3_9HYPH|nr:hypothetical protein [Candidatus Rhodoblastus alkanivorans]MCI4677613.1 hypothetical protein [Candidatus Rhodoblastus alkanivorans]MCI4682655.1 hypothetical protein [Candidatus Rhodoblastus alkanivorans]MDI4639961.1 hypothetical protein [Rhodoblastus acidophilus]
MRLCRLALAALLVLAPALVAPARAEGAKDFGTELAVKVVNKSTPELCAERDNVELDFISPQVRHMTVQAVHPAYIGMIKTDRWAPDFSACNMPHGEGALPRKTFYESPTLWLTGLIDPNFWRPTNIPIRVGDHVESGFAYIQLWMLYRERAEEVLVLYPADGNWRIRPLPFGDMRWTAYGSSFQIGPLEVQDSPAGPRPIVAIKDIAFNPATKAFTLDFVRGGSATVTLKLVDQDHIALDVSYSGAMPGDLPFAALRSMYTTETNSDVARVAWREKDGKGWKESPIMSFPGASVTELWAGRHAPSRHNLSAPDMVFSHFAP